MKLLKIVIIALLETKRLPVSRCHSTFETITLQFLKGDIPHSFHLLVQNKSVILKTEPFTSQKNKPNIHIFYDCADIN